MFAIPKVFVYVLKGLNQLALLNVKVSKTGSFNLRSVAGLVIQASGRMEFDIGGEVLFD